MSIKSGSQQLIDNSVMGLELVSALINLGKNPTAVKQMTDQLLEVNSLSKERRKEAEAAELTIMTSAKAAKKLQEDTTAHQAAVEEDGKKIKVEYGQLEKVKAAHEDQKVEFEKYKQVQLAELKDAASRAESHFQAARNHYASANGRHEEADARQRNLAIREEGMAQAEKDLTERQKAHDKTVAEFREHLKTIGLAATKASTVAGG